MSCLVSKTRLLARLSKPGMVGAIVKVSRGSVQTAASEWRCGRAPSAGMLEELRAAVPKAELWLRRREARLAQEAKKRDALLRGMVPVLKRLVHGGSKAARDPAVMTVGKLAVLAGLRRELVQGIRDESYIPALKTVEHLAAVMVREGLLPKAGKAGTNHGLKPELQTMKGEHDA